MEMANQYSKCQGNSKESMINMGQSGRESSEELSLELPPGARCGCVWEIHFHDWGRVCHSLIPRFPSWHTYTPDSGKNSTLEKEGLKVSLKPWDICWGMCGGGGRHSYLNNLHSPCWPKSSPHQNVSAQRASLTDSPQHTEIWFASEVYSGFPAPAGNVSACLRQKL